jgi:CheY-like chemotaxis protein
VSPISILHLEDSAIDAELIYERLRLQGLDVVIRRVETRGEFIAALDEGGFDMIFADHTLPDYDGMSALDAA